MNDKAVMSVKECAQILGSNERHIREGIDNKTFPFGICWKSRSGQRIYKISRSALMRFINGNGGDCDSTPED